MTEASTPGAVVGSIEFEVLVRRSVALHEQGYFEAARQVALEVVARQKDHIGALIALANALRDLGRFDDALRVLSHVLRLSPDNTTALSSAALTFFFKEDWPRAWRSFDVRFKLMERPPAVTMPGPDGEPVPKPRWREGPVPPSILVLGEQGLGDTIMFARYLPLLRKASARVVCVVQQRLITLLETLNADIEWRPLEQAGNVSGIKAWTTMMQLPHALGLTPDQFTQTIPYLRAESARAARWKENIGTHGFKVGIAWQGNPDKRIDVGRSAPLASFAPLAEISGVRLISLQTHSGLDQLTQVPFGDRVERLGDNFDSGNDGFLDAAAVMEHLDLIITVDTSIGHLAGALGRPAIILLKAVGADWRWLHQRVDTIWYPSLRLFRQHRPGDWHELLARVAADVQNRITASGDLTPVAPVSVGELLDKISILAIKRERIADPVKRANVETEYHALVRTSKTLALPDGVQPLLAQIKAVNETLWDIEDDIRGCEAKSDFGSRFVELARSVYKQNDKRAALKTEINRLCNSSLREEKFHKPY